MKTLLISFILSLISLTICIAQKIYKATLLLDAKATLGEGSIWHPGEKKLYWIDIDEKTLHTYDPDSKEETHYPLKQKVGTIVPIDTGGVLVALKDGVYAFNMKANIFRFITSPEKDLTENRFNDGKCDPWGRFWVGTIGPRYKAALYRITAPSECTKMLDSITTSNGIVWSSDKTKMFYIDTPTGEVRQYNYDNNTGNISNAQIVVKFPKGIGYPDGMTIDSEGMLWIAHWGGSCVGRWNPVTGNMIAKVEVPALNITSCAFGGKYLDTLYITTAKTGMNEKQLKQFPLSGGVFSVTVDVKGTPANYFNTKHK